MLLSLPKIFKALGVCAFFKKTRLVSNILLSTLILSDDFYRNITIYSYIVCICVKSLELCLFPVVIYGCESWTIKKAECRIDAFELWYWRRLLRVPWTARRSNQSIFPLKGLMLKLKLQYFGHLMQRTDSFEETLMLGKIEGRRRRG